MDKQEIIEKLKGALEELKTKHGFLVNENTNERSITHMFASILQSIFTDYHVDCEYNRMTNEDGDQITKRIYGNPEELVSVNDLDAKTVYPDIVIHRREDSEHNLLVIEAKKSNNNDRETDYEKLKTYMNDRNSRGLGYKFSAFIIFNVNNPEDLPVEVKESGENWTTQ